MFLNCTEVIDYSDSAVLKPYSYTKETNIKIRKL